MPSEEREIRRFPRIHAEHLISVRPVTGRKSSVETVTTSKVVGLGGLMFESARRLRLGTRLELSILVGSELIKVTVRVVWCRKEGETWHAGVAFEDITEKDQDKILDFLMRRVALEEEIGK
jgi:hypothetical protein